jgi:hypothetical protein
MSSFWTRACSQPASQNPMTTTNECWRLMAGLDLPCEWWANTSLPGSGERLRDSALCELFHSTPGNLWNRNTSLVNGGRKWEGILETQNPCHSEESQSFLAFSHVIKFPLGTELPSRDYISQHPLHHSIAMWLYSHHILLFYSEEIVFHLPGSSWLSVEYIEESRFILLT